MFLQSVTIKFCVTLDQNSNKTLGMLIAAYREATMKKLSVLINHKNFEEGLEDVKDDGRLKCLKTNRTWENVEKLGYRRRAKFRQGIRNYFFEDGGEKAATAWHFMWFVIFFFFIWIFWQISGDEIWCSISTQKQNLRAMENKKFIKTKESANVMTIDRNHTYLFLRSQGHCSLWIY